MASIAVSVIDANNISLVLTARPPVSVTLDRGVAGIGIASISGTTISGSYYLVVTYTNGATQNVGPFALTGTVAAGSTTQIQYNSGGALAGSANLTWNGSALGVGGAVNAATGLNVTGAGGFINSSNKFGVDNNAGTTRMYASGPNSLTRGTFEFHTTDSVGTLDTIQATLSSTGFAVTGALSATGNVGIGTASPTYKLEVVGNSYFNGEIYTGAYTTISSLTSDLLIRAGTGGKLRLGANGSNDFAVLDTSGNLGIGVTPSAWGGQNVCQVGVGSLTNNYSGDWTNLSSNAYYNGTSWRYIGSTTATKYQQLNSSHQWFTAPSGTAGAAISFTQAMTLDANGNLGLGVAPSAWVSTTRSIALPSGASFSNGSDGYRTHITLNAYESAANVWRYQVALPVVKYTQIDGAHQWYTAPSGTAGTAITFTQAMTLDAAGQVGVAVTPSTWASSWKGIEFQVGGSVGSFSTGTMVIGANNINNGTNSVYKTTAGASLYSQYNGSHAWYSAASGTAGSTISWSIGMQMNTSGVSVDKLFAVTHIAGTGSGIPYINFSYAGTTIGSITQSGTTAVLYNTTSDYRLKNNARALVGSGEFIDALKPTTWEWSEDGRTDSGFLAHEFQTVSPYSVNGEKDAEDEEGNAVYQSMQASSAQVIANLVAELQDLRKRLAAAGL